MPPPPSNIVFARVETPTDETFVHDANDIMASVMGQGRYPAHEASLALTGGDMTRVARLGGLMIRPISLLSGVGHAYTARDEIGALVGFLLFTLPGQLMLSTDEQRKMGMYEYMADLSPEVQEYFAETMGKEVPKLNDQMFGIEAAERTTYWCNMAMVRAEYQGKGIAKRMFQMAFDEAAKLGATVALTTTNRVNVPIYEKIGFTLRGEKTVPSPWVNWMMWYFSKDTEAQ
ncbi:uncharacterized protein BXZ73DRAFT_106621 [Epithele typhae]|uniref:uncharacterized protein n=1 Tax=Epithele typhae TaxID=378194 RepID=UPI00200833AB|nr:uncharacterized protein BXZ73DRAFT_106621 [Epithele typhae]KAH9914379.1 hypothetical protein BXZ73DRAFT_106621 [Epithele typhae]